MSGDDRIFSSDAKASLETLESCVVVVVEIILKRKKLVKENTVFRVTLVDLWLPRMRPVMDGL